LSKDTDDADAWVDRVQVKPHGDNDNVLDSRQVHSVDIDPSVAQNLATIGRLRFDTVLIRNLIFIVNLYRSVRVKLQRDLSYNRDIILKSNFITNPQNTEYYGNQIDKERQRYLDGKYGAVARYNY
jgi:hypothetical protein